MVLPMYSAGGCSTAVVGAAADPVVDRDVVVVVEAAVEELEAVGPSNENADAESVFFSSLADESAVFGAAAAAPNEKPDAGAVVDELPVPVVVEAPDVVEAAPNEMAGAAVEEDAPAEVLAAPPKPKPEDDVAFLAGGSTANPNPLLEAVGSVVLGAAAAAPKLNPDVAAPSFLGELGLSENELVVLPKVLEPAVDAVLLAAGAGAEAPKLNPELGVEGAAAAVVEATGVALNAKPVLEDGLLVLAAPNEKPPELEAAGVAVAGAAAAGAALLAPKEKLLEGAAAEVAAGAAAAPNPKPVEAAGAVVGVEAAGVADAPPKENPPLVAAGAALLLAPKEKPEAGAVVGVAGLAPKENPPAGAAGAAAGVPKEKPPLLLPSVLAPKLNAIRLAWVSKGNGAPARSVNTARPVN